MNHIDCLAVAKAGRKELRKGLRPMLVSPAKKTSIVKGSAWSGLPEWLRDHKAVSVRFPLPLFHATQVVRVKGKQEGWTARILILETPDGEAEIYAPLLHYMLKNHAYCATWQNCLARGVGLFWDYCRAHAGPALETQAGFRADLFEAFIIALLDGTVVQGRDDTGLCWPATNRTQVKLIFSRMRRFSDWCVSNGHAEGLTGTRTPAQNPDARKTIVWSRLREIAVFAHLASEKPERRVREHELFGAEPGSMHVQPVHAFPADRIRELLDEGHMRPGHPENGPYYMTYNIRDQMMVLLDAWGGLRRSEGLHLWVNDIGFDTETREAIVTLAHPVWSKMRHGSGKNSVSLTRKEYLNQVYGLVPRNQHKRGRYHVGWKGMELNSYLEERVYWRDREMGQRFHKLFLMYLTCIRDPIMDARAKLYDPNNPSRNYNHPFLFVSEAQGSSGLLGDPYSMQAYERNHAAAVARLNMDYEKSAGTTTHGLRHLYGRTLARAGVEPGIIKLGLHHRTYLAQAPYTKPDFSEASEDFHRALSQPGSAQAPKRHGSPDGQAIGVMADKVRGGR